MLKLPISLISKLDTIHKKISKRIVFDKSIGVEDTVFLASVGRSGSTFLSNVINYNNRFRVMFEPFRYDVVDEAKEFIYPFYLRPDNSNLNFFLAAKKIISGQVSSDWVNSENARLFPQARLIKDIRVNFFLKWIHNNFPEMKMILLLRHPCAVVHSWISAGFGSGRQARERLLANHHFVSDMDDILLKEYLKAETDFEKLIFFWCFSYHVPFQQFNFDDIHLVFYENLILHPKDEVRKLFQVLGYKYSEAKVLNSFSKPSSTTKKTESFFGEKLQRVDQWQKDCSKEQSARAYEIMKLFGMDKLYCPISSIPNMEVLEGLFGSRL